MINEAYIKLKTRVERLGDELDFRAPELVLKTELELIREALEEIEKNI